MTDRRPTIGITMGDPAGIGPELCLRVIRDEEVISACTPVIFGDSAVLDRVADVAGLVAPEQVAPIEEWDGSFRADSPIVLDCGAVDADAVRAGEVQKNCGEAAYAYIEAGIDAAKEGRISALVTCPIHKESLRLAGVSYPGHTELLAARTATRDYCMMLASDEISVSLVTTHVAHRDVVGGITKKRIRSVICLTHDAMLRFGKPNPKITVCGLNPHAGERGLFGSEETEVILPAIEAERETGKVLLGPLPPDTAFIPERLAETDAYVVMYHDQGLIPFKMLAFDKGVNVTLGLPIIRTSVDHGTAFDIAWQGKASPGSILQAILYAVRLSSAS